MTSARICYYVEPLPWIISTVSIPTIATVPRDGVVYVEIERDGCKQQLRGMDNYWIDVESKTFGAFNDPENADSYEGMQAIAFRWDESGHVFIGEVTAPPSAIIVHGIMLPDDRAKEIGLL